MKKVALMLAIATQAHADVGNGAGNGGDLLRTLFNEARPAAVERLQKLEPCALDSKTPAQVKEWILANKEALAVDVHVSSHRWITDKQATCAWTTPNSADEIVLSFEACRPLVTNRDAAVHILIHESVHHFGVTDETLPEQIAVAVMTANREAHCPSPGDPFDPSICKGEPVKPAELIRFFPPGQKEVVLGPPDAPGVPDSYQKTYPVRSRDRYCVGEHCNEWQFNELGPDNQARRFRSILSIQSGQFLLTIQHPCGGYYASTTCTGLGTADLKCDFPYSSYGGCDLGDDVWNFTGLMTHRCIILRSDAKYSSGKQTQAAIYFPL
jgi:hypothetical protein